MPAEARRVSIQVAREEGLPIHPGQLMAGLPARMEDLWMYERNGYYWVVPWFVAWLDNGVPEFRAADWRKFREAIRMRRCWVCGKALGVHLTFVLGPMCTITRTTAEPPCHLDCAIWSARSCPFLATPQMIRRPAPMPAGAVESPGIGLARNPGVTALWSTRTFQLMPDQNGRPLIQVGDPEEVLWFCEGRKATRAEVEESIRTGLPALTELAIEDDALAALERQAAHARAYLPAGS